MAELASDREAIAHLGLNEALVGQLLRKTRQAINAGLDKRSYLKDHELTILLLWLRSNKADAMPALETYIRATRPKTAETIISAYSNFASFAAIAASAVRITLVIPGYANFSQRYPTLAHTIRCEVAKSPKKYQVIVVLENDRHAFVRDVLDTAKQVGIKAAVGDIAIDLNQNADAMPYMLFCDNANRFRAPYVFVGERIEEIDGLRGEEMYAFLHRRRLNAKPVRSKTVSTTSTRGQRQPRQHRGQ